MKRIDVKELKKEAEGVIRRVNHLPEDKPIPEDYLGLVDKAFAHLVVWECTYILHDVRYSFVTSNSPHAERFGYAFETLYTRIKRSFGLTEKGRI